MRKPTAATLVRGTLAGAVLIVSTLGGISPALASECDYAQNEATSLTVPLDAAGFPGGELTVFVETTPNAAGRANADAALGTCVDLETGAFQGGNLEVGNGTGGGNGSYAVIEGDDDNTLPSSAGYAGVSNYRDGGAEDTVCDGNDTDSDGGTNSGGCVTLRLSQLDPSLPNISVPVPLIVCGNTTGNWNSSDRDGCSLP